jgi:hypothetical protein
VALRARKICFVRVGKGVVGVEDGETVEVCGFGVQSGGESEEGLFGWRALESLVDIQRDVGIGRIGVLWSGDSPT